MTSKSRKVKKKQIQVKAGDRYQDNLDQTTLDRINEVYEVETRVAILFAIDSFGSCNIKKLGKILSKNEATIFHHLKSLIREPSLIKLDEKLTLEKKGKYYQLTDFANKYFGSLYRESSEKGKEMSTDLKQKWKSILKLTDKEISQYYMNMLRKHPDSLNQAGHEKKNLTYNHILERLFVNNIKKAAIAFNDNKKPINPSYPMGTLVNFSLDMKISKPRHIIEVMLFYGEMASKFYELERKIATEMADQEISEDKKINLRYHIVGGEVETFEFE